MYVNEQPMVKEICGNNSLFIRYNKVRCGFKVFKNKEPF